MAKEFVAPGQWISRHATGYDYYDGVHHGSVRATPLWTSRDATEEELALARAEALEALRERREYAR